MSFPCLGSVCAIQDMLGALVTSVWHSFRLLVSTFAWIVCSLSSSLSLQSMGLSPPLPCELGLALLSGLIGTKRPPQTSCVDSNATQCLYGYTLDLYGLYFF
eukprot:6473261-Amphidinium_carterae.4